VCAGEAIKVKEEKDGRCDAIYIAERIRIRWAREEVREATTRRVKRGREGKAEMGRERGNGEVGAAREEMAK